MPRRIVSGLDSKGESAIVIDEEMQFSSGFSSGNVLAWMTENAPADNEAFPQPGAVFDFNLIHSAASTFNLARMPPGSRSEMHATNTIDYITMISGQITFGVETCSVTLSPGDLLIDRGIIHSWRNDGIEDAVFSVVTMPAFAVGSGRTM